MATCKGFSLMSGGLDSQLAVRVLQRAGAEVEAVCFSTPFFDCSSAEQAAAALDVKLHVVDFTDDELSLIENPPHGFGGAMNPCIDCHALMIRRAGELMTAQGFDFVATGEVLGQRPMSQNRQALGIVEKSSGLIGRLVRPLSARLLETTLPEAQGVLDRAQLLDISGRSRDRQIALAAEFGITAYPSPAGGCKLTEEGFGRKLKDLLDHEGLKNRRLVDLLVVARHFRLPDGTGLIVGRDRMDNARIDAAADLGQLIFAESGPGPHTLIIGGAKSDRDLEMAHAITEMYVKGSTIDRERYQPYHIC